MSFIEIVKSGHSFSGRERHCAFLNDREGVFADISAVSGLDLPDDGRGAVLVDWDFDGDLDLWVTNRNAPQLRFLKNARALRGRWIAFRLEGLTANRDAIGARLELHVDENEPPLLRTLRAGDGFLSQGSKWIHVGLGKADGVQRLVIRWPGGEMESLNDLAANRHYHIRQGEGRARPWQAPRDSALPDLPEAFLPEPPDQQGAIVFTHAGIPLLAVRYQSFDTAHDEAVVAGKPVLLNLWASWCAPCVDELHRFTEQAEALQRFGLDVVAVSLDYLTDRGRAPDARRLLERMNWPFRAGQVSRATADQLQRIHNFVFDLHDPLVIPTSFLIDGAGNLQAIIKGPVDPDDLMARVSRLTSVPMEGPERRALTVPFAGRWFAPARRLHYIDLALGEAESGNLADALDYFNQNETIFAQSPAWPRLLVTFGRRLAAERRPAEAEMFFRRAEEAAPEYVEALDERVRLWLENAEIFGDRKDEAIRLAEHACRLTGYRNPELLETLALAQAGNGNTRAAADRLREAAAIARESGRVDLAETLENRLRALAATEATSVDPP